MDVKNYCSVHHYYYNGLACPYCMVDKSSILYEKVYKGNDSIKEKKSNTKEKVNKAITQADLDKLVEKYSIKRH